MAKPLSEFEKAFAEARARGEKTFDYKGTPTRTNLKGESEAEYEAGRAKRAERYKRRTQGVPLDAVKRAWPEEPEGRPEGMIAGGKAAWEAIKGAPAEPASAASKPYSRQYLGPELSRVRNAETKKRGGLIKAGRGNGIARKGKTKGRMV